MAQGWAVQREKGRNPGPISGISLDSPQVFFLPEGELNEQLPAVFRPRMLGPQVPGR